MFIIKQSLTPKKCAVYMITLGNSINLQRLNYQIETVFRRISVQIFKRSH